MLDCGPTIAGLLRWQIANGKKVNVLQHYWINELPINHWPTTKNNKELEGKTVADLISEDGNWDQPTLLAQFGLHLAQVIEATIINIELMEDSIMLQHYNIDRTITSMAYEVQFQVEPKKIKWLDQLKLHLRECIFGGGS